MRRDKFGGDRWAHEIYPKQRKKKKKPSGLGYCDIIILVTGERYSDLTGRPWALLITKRTLVVVFWFQIL